MALMGQALLQSYKKIPVLLESSAVSDFNSQRLKNANNVPISKKNQQMFTSHVLWIQD
jgi:hypothetical protein